MINILKAKLTMLACIKKLLATSVLLSVVYFPAAFSQAETANKVTVSVSFVELHSGPGIGYPVLYAVSYTHLTLPTIYSV